MSLKKSMAKESIGQFMHRAKNGGARKPLRSLDELAQEFGITKRALVSLLAHRDGPKPIYRTGGSATNRQTYYDPKKVREWFKSTGYQGKP